MKIRTFKSKYDCETTPKKSFWAKAPYFSNLYPHPEGWGNCRFYRINCNVITSSFRAGVVDKLPSVGFNPFIKAGAIMDNELGFTKINILKR
ncbi:MAG: hypothetical protein H8E70_07605 [Candidatus Marinimicrobia bacterium]|nr:hypothetical protein [Candidatus Neomarinimicrobiota bacterium]